MAVAFARLGISNGSFSFLSGRGEWPPSIFARPGLGRLPAYATMASRRSAKFSSPAMPGTITGQRETLVSQGS